MAVETLAIDIWLDSILSINETLIDLLGEPFNTASTIKRKTVYQSGNALYVPITGNGKLYKIIVSGRTGTDEPVFPTDDLSTVVDGTVTWQMSGDIDLRPRIFESVAPATAKEPFIVFNLQNPDTSKRVGMGGTDLFGTYTYQVRATDRGHDKTVVAKAADAIDNILNIGEGEGDYVITFNERQYDVLGCYRDIPIDISEIADEVRYTHMGGLYPVLISAR